MARTQVPAQLGHAFVFLNAFIDVYEAIEDGSTDALDVSELVPAGVPPTFPVPSLDAAYATSADLEAAKEWVINAAMQEGTEQSLSMRSCSNCGADVYEGALRCDRCDGVSEACAVTGYPIPAGEKVETKGTHRVAAARDDFNVYVGFYGACPFSGVAQAVIQ
jgi:intraflagellar transport protein 172